MDQLQDYIKKDNPFLYLDINSSTEQVDLEESYDKSVSSLYSFKEILKKFPSSYYNLWKRLELDSSSVFLHHFRIGHETSLIDQGIKEKDSNLLQTTKIVAKLIKSRRIFKNLEKEEVLRFLSPLVKKILSEHDIHITEIELTKRIEKIMLIETMFGMLKDLNSRQKNIFEESIKRRKFFK